MTRCSGRVAVFAAWLVLGSMALAQPGSHPSPVGATRILDPISYTPTEPPPPMVPGPLNPQIAPVGPPDSLNLPASHTNAFVLDGYPPESAAFGSVGVMWLMRQNLPKTTIAYLDDQNFQVDSGSPPRGNLQTLLPLDRVHPTKQLGYRATVGYLWGNEAIEFTGFYQPDETNSTSIVRRGQVYVPFGPTGTFPIGFEGNNGLWLQADRVEARFTNAVANLEANYQWWNSGLNDFHLIMGVRYFYNQERLDIATDDEYFVRDLFDKPDPKRQATYSSMGRTNHVGFQVGGEYSAPFIPQQGYNWLWFSGVVKSSSGVNYIERSWRLTRGDGYGGFDKRRNTFNFGNVTEAGAYVDIHFLERLRVRAGYMALIGFGFATAADTLDYNFTTQGAKPSDTTSIYWHGPMLEFQMLF